MSQTVRERDASELKQTEAVPKFALKNETTQLWWSATAYPNGLKTG